MRARITLDGRKNVETTKGFPIIIYVTKNKKEKPIRTGYFSKKKDWDNSNALPKKSHPDYIGLVNYLETRKIEVIKLLENDRVNNLAFDRIIDILKNSSSGVFYKDGMDLANRLNNRSYKIALNSFQSFFPDFTYEQIDTSVANDYKKRLLVTPTLNSKKTRSPNGVISYLNSLITIWNKSTDHKNPFSGVKPKKQKTKSKALTVDDLLKIKNNDYASHMNARGGGIKNYLNYLMLCFYLGGIDLGDLVNLRYDEHVSNGRIEFNRFKGGTNVLVSNYIFPEAWELLQKYDCKPYLIPLALTNNYNTFIPNMSRYFASIQEKLKLSKKPYSKAPRYSFITRAQQILIDERITIEIVGHSQQSTHSIYKDEFPFHVRDEAHKKIIDLNYNHL